MWPESMSDTGFDDIQQILTDGIAGARSLAEIDAWLQSQPCVESVALAPHLLKSNPPQREFAVEFRMEDGSVAPKILNIFDLGESSFGFHELRDP